MNDGFSSKQLSASGNPDFDYAAGKPNHYRIMRYKQDLVRRLGPVDALASFRTTFGWPNCVEINYLPVKSEREYAASMGRFFFETGIAGIPFVNNPPPVVGESECRPLHGVTRSQYVACLSHARTRGRAATVLTGGQLLVDFQSSELEMVDEEFSWDPAILHTENGAALYLESVNEADPIHLTEAFNLLGAHTDFFGHWMCEYLPKLGHAVMSGVLPKLPFLIDANMPPSHRRSIELLFPELGPIIEVPAFTSVIAERLWVAPDISYYPLYDAGTGRFEWDAIAVCAERIGPVMSDLRVRGMTNCKANTRPVPRIFLARKPFRHRRMVNDQDVYAEARRHGFSIIYPEDLTFDEQIAFMQGASYVIITEGSAMFLAQFASPGTKVCILSHPMNEPMADFNEIFKALDMSLTSLVGPIVKYEKGTPHDSSYQIDTSLFAAHLYRWLDSN